MTPKHFMAAIDAAAEAAFDRFYEIGPATSDMGYMFEDAKTKQAWREVVVAALKALEEV